MQETIGVLCYGDVEISTCDAVDIRFSVNGPDNEYGIGWLLSIDESRQIRKALKKAEKTVSRGE